MDMNEKNTLVRYTMDNLPPDDTDWERVLNMTEEEIEQNALSDPDAPPMTEEDWKRARLVIPLDRPHPFVAIDPGALAWFRENAGDEDYRKSINDVLRAYVKRKKKKEAA